MLTRISRKSAFTWWRSSLIRYGFLQFAGIRQLSCQLAWTHFCLCKFNALTQGKSAWNTQSGILTGTLRELSNRWHIYRVHRNTHASWPQQHDILLCAYDLEWSLSLPDAGHYDQRLLSFIFEMLVQSIPCILFHVQCTVTKSVLFLFIGMAKCRVQTFVFGKVCPEHIPCMISPSITMYHVW